MFDVRLSTNFHRREFACRGKNCCGDSFPVMPELVIILQAIRDEFGLTMHVSSGFRCNTHNAQVGGSDWSWHTIGGAADCLILKSVTYHTMYQFCKTIPELGGLGIYDDHYHFDVRPRIGGIITAWDKRTTRP